MDYYDHKLHPTLSAGNAQLHMELKRERWIDKKWVLSNMLPTKIYLYIETRQFQGYIQYLDVLNPRETKYYVCNQINDGDRLYVFDKDNGHSCYISSCDVRRHMILQPEYLRDFQKCVRIGDVVYNEFDGARNVTASHSDISGFYIYNSMNRPLDVHFHGRHVGIVGAYDGKGYHSGSSAQLFFDNARDGIKLGDRIGFSYNNGHDCSICEKDRRPQNNFKGRNRFGEENPLIFEVEIVDTHMHNMHVGVINSSDNTLHPDISAYKIMSEPHTGVSYYVHDHDAVSSPQRTGDPRTKCSSMEDPRRGCSSSAYGTIRTKAY